MNERQTPTGALRTGALSEREASELGRIVAGQLGAEVTVEQLTAQRLRLAHAFGPQRRAAGPWDPRRVVNNLGSFIGARTGAVALGGIAAALVVGIGLGLSGYRSELEWPQSGAVGLSPEPLRAPEHSKDDLVVTAADDRVRAPQGTWRNRGRGVVVVDGWLQADREPLELEWVQQGEAKGTNSVRLDPGARARVLGVGEDGLVLSLEHGSVEVQRQGVARAARCEVFAGPYRVRTSDASYELSWSTETRQMALRVNQGQALVEELSVEESAVHEFSDEVVQGDERSDKAPHAGERAVRRSQVVSAGQRVQFGESRLRSKDSAKHGKRASSASTTTEQTLETTPPEKSRAEDLAVRGAANTQLPSNADNTRWKALAESGQYREAVAVAKEVGFETLSANASPSDLLLLADAARLGGATGQARSTLQLLRQNFPTHTNAAIAAFTLGRMAQELDHNDRAALKWYRTYLRQEPQGRMAEGARARILKGALRVGTKDEVQSAARDYLAHHPSGSSAALARQSL